MTPPSTRPRSTRCAGAALLYTGEYVDWDSSDASFLGIDNATVTVEGDAGSAITEKTPPNGRLTFCLQTTTNPLISFTPDPTDTGDPYLPGLAFANELVFKAGGQASSRSMRASRVVTMFQQIGSAFDPTKGQLVVHTTNTAATLSISQAHDAVQAYDTNGNWSAGSAGEYVFFPNIATTGTVSLTASDTTLLGLGSIPVTGDGSGSGHLTYAEVLAK